MPVELWFPTPIYYSQLEGANLDAIQSELAVAFDSLKSSNSFGQATGWGFKTHRVSDPTFIDNVIDTHNLIKFKDEIYFHVREYMQGLHSASGHKFRIASSWFTETRQGEYTRVHNHGSADISGVYYFKTNEKDGAITFISPGQLLPAIVFTGLKDTVTYQPKNGKLILFPGCLYHTVAENETAEDRISVSFNIYFDR
jgi:uncharacterized protein (TIGR02466 family)